MPPASENRHSGRSEAESRNPCVDGPRLARASQLENGLVDCGHVSGLYDAVG
jgi:hypothetical protein